jgi:anti-sigma regulatory factor (Ser/Thr protein kinase)
VKTQRCSIRLAPRLENLQALERFVALCPFLDQLLRERATLVATEFFDNIVTHSRPRTRYPVSVTIERSSAARIVIRYCTMNFQKMIRGARSAHPHYDPSSARYRGLGLLMCRNLSSSIDYKKGLLRSSIVIIL